MISFSGFSRQSIQFLTELEQNNSKAWFVENRHLYDNYLFPEAQLFTVAMGRLLSKTLAPQLQAIPKTDKSIFRLHRDVRFSKDKRPYKTHLGIFLWEGEGKKLDCPGFYFQLNANKVLLGVGLHIIPKHLLPVYRDAVIDDEKGNELIKSLDLLLKNEGFVLSEKQYKKIPRGYSSEQPNSDLLLYGGMAAMYEGGHPAELHKPELVDYCFNIFSKMSPIHHWWQSILRDHQAGTTLK